MEHVQCFLMGLDESYSQTHGQILLMDLFPNISNIFFFVVARGETKIGC